MLTRDPQRALMSLRGIDAYASGADHGAATPGSPAGWDVVFNLAGDSVASGRWTEEKKRRIRESRVLGTPPPGRKPGAIAR